MLPRILIPPGLPRILIPPWLTGNPTVPTPPGLVRILIPPGDPRVPGAPSPIGILGDGPLETPLIIEFIPVLGPPGVPRILGLIPLIRASPGVPLILTSPRPRNKARIGSPIILAAGAPRGGLNSLAGLMGLAPMLWVIGLIVIIGLDPFPTGYVSLTSVPEVAALRLPVMGDLGGALTM